MPKVRQTRNYDLFELTLFNRDVKKIKSLEKSMVKHGWIDAYPMHVMENGDNSFKIKAGHHRFTVAKKLGLPVKYVVSNDDATIYELEQSTNFWTLQDYLTSHIRYGEKDYLKIQEYIDKTGISLGNAISLLAGESASSNNKYEQFKRGTYRVKSTYYADKVAELVLFCKNAGISFANQALFVQAISKVVWVPEFDSERFKRKVNKFGSLAEKQQNLSAYLDMLENIYNRHEQNKLPLRFLTEQTGKKRQKTFGKI